MKRHNIIDLVDDTDDASTDKQTNPNKRQQTQPIKSESKQSETSTPPLSQTSQSSQSHDDIEYGFYLNEIRGLNNQHSIKISDLVTGAIEQAVLLNYCWDLPWLLKEIPLLARIPNVHLVSGQRDTDLKQQAYDTKLTNIRVHLASLPVPWGCHHSKCLLLFYNHGCRVIIMTANFLECDLHYKNQAIWYQDFPLKPADRTSICNTEVGTDFERTLKEYFAVYRKCGLDVIESIEKYDFSAAKAILIPALPGAFVNESIRKLGHMKVRHWLTKQVMSSEMQAAPVVAQFSSLGSLSEKWMNEFTLSLSQHADRGISNRLPELKIVWPRTVDVQWSVEGWAAGGSLCCDTKNVKPHVLSRYHRWDGLAQNRHRAMPHIKSYSRACASRIGFAIVGSANLSTAAWGALQKADSQLALRHYEMSVLVASFVYEKLRSLKHPNYWFSCTDQRMERAPLSATTTVLQSASRAIAKRDEHSVLCPFPYDIHPKPYAKDDKGWVWDQPFSEPDVHSMKWCGARSKAEGS